MATAIHVRPSDTFIRDILQAAFPGYCGRRVSVRVTDSVRFAGTQWSGGTRKRYKLIRLADFALAPIPEEDFLNASSLHLKAFTIPEGFAVVELTEGHFEAVAIIVSSANVIPALPAPDALPEDERTVLAATRSLVSSYGGIKNFRFHEASRKTGITLDRWESAKASLIAKRLLNKAGAITPEGRNAIGDERL